MAPEQAGPTIVPDIPSLEDYVGKPLGTTSWVALPQQQIDAFAEATGDHQWIHVDPARAADGPYGATIAHGYLTLSLVNFFLPQILEVRGISAGINVGSDRVRFPAPVVVGSRLRGSGVLLAAEAKKGGVQIVVRMTVEIEGAERPAAVVDCISRFLPS